MLTSDSQRETRCENCLEYFSGAQVISIKRCRSGEFCDLKGQFIYKNRGAKEPRCFFSNICSRPSHREKWKLVCISLWFIRIAQGPIHHQPWIERWETKASNSSSILTRLPNAGEAHCEVVQMTVYSGGNSSSSSAFLCVILVDDWILDCVNRFKQLTQSTFSRSELCICLTVCVEHTQCKNTC